MGSHPRSNVDTTYNQLIPAISLYHGYIGYSWIVILIYWSVQYSTMPNEATGVDPSHCSSSRPVSSWTQAVWILVSMRPEGRPSAKIGHRAMTKLAAGQKPVRSKQFGVGETP